MTKNEAKNEFKGHFPKLLERGDKAEIRESWNNFVDGLQKAGDVTERQAETWMNPFLSKKDR